VFREVGGDHVTYFSPYSADSLRDALSTACDLPLDLGSSGEAIAKTFSWDRSAERFEATLRRLQPVRALEALARP
jgi:glycosyltransferase involved in cell wall biosynthesis